MTVGDVGDCSGNVMNGLYLHDGLLIDMIKTLMRTSPTPNMKKVLLCRNVQ